MTRDDLRRSDLLSRCSETEVDEVLRRSSEIAVASGELLFSDDDKADAVWVILEGELVITKVAGGDEVIIDSLGPGAYLGEISLLTASPAHHRARAKGATRLFRIPSEVFYDLLRSCSAVTETVLRTMAERVRRIEHMLQQRERMATLGTIAAGLAHELNNPASAAKRALGLLKEEFAQLEPLAERLAEHEWSPEEVELLGRLQRVTTAGDGSNGSMDAVERSDREEALTAWLDGRGVQRAGEMGALLADRGIVPEQLDKIASGCAAGVLADALAWTERMTTIRQLIEEAGQSTARISDMVRAVKAYSYVDTSTLRTADVHEGLENSLTILTHKLREVNVKAIREFDRKLPPIQSYGTELNQVWTNLIDNAADAASGHGATIRLKTSRDGASVLVEVIDSGPGIPKELQARIFDPFFTTKAAGKGTGLGLEIAKRIVTRHKGTIDVTSEPGNTRVAVRIPVVQSD